MLLPFKVDLDAVVRDIAPHCELLRRRRIFITGVTGIIGKWLLASLLHADRQLQLDLHIDALSRQPERFAAYFPIFAQDSRVTLWAGDIRQVLTVDRCYDYVIHAATDVVAQTASNDLLDTCVTGTRRILEFAKKSGVQRMLLLSSGAVYGKTPTGHGAIAEDFNGPLDFLSPDSAYAQGKRCAELLCVTESLAGSLAIPMARCFAMVGPYLPLDKHFAIGNFIHAALNGQPIVIKGDGTPIRSYLYLSEVATQLILLLLLGRSGISYNIGGSEPVTIAELASRVAQALSAPVEILLENRHLHGMHASAYYPDTTRIRHEFGLGPGMSLDEAIKKTADWYRQ